MQSFSGKTIGLIILIVIEDETYANHDNIYL